MVRVRHTAINDETGQRLHEFVTTNPQQSIIDAGDIVDGTVGNAELNTGLVRYIDKQLTDTEVKALTTAVLIVPAPGANLALIFHKAWVVVDAAAGAYVEPSAPDDPIFQLTGGADVSASMNAGSLIGASINKMAVDSTSTTDIVVNQGIEIFNTGANWTGGNVANSMSIRVWYSIVSAVAFS